MGLVIGYVIVVLLLVIGVVFVYGKDDWPDGF